MQAHKQGAARKGGQNTLSLLARTFADTHLAGWSPGPRPDSGGLLRLVSLARFTLPRFSPARSFTPRCSSAETQFCTSSMCTTSRSPKHHSSPCKASWTPSHRRPWPCGAWRRLELRLGVLPNLVRHRPDRTHGGQPPIATPWSLGPASRAPCRSPPPPRHPCRAYDHPRRRRLEPQQHRPDLRRCACLGHGGLDCFGLCSLARGCPASPGRHSCGQRPCSYRPSARGSHSTACAHAPRPGVDHRPPPLCEVRPLAPRRGTPHNPRTGRRLASRQARVAARRHGRPSRCARRTALLACGPGRCGPAGGASGCAQ